MALAEPSLTEGTKKLTVVAPTKVDIREVNKQINTKNRKYNKQTVAVTYIDIGQSKTVHFFLRRTKNARASTD